MRGFLSQDLLQIFFTISLDPMNERSLGVISVSPYAANVTKVHFCWCDRFIIFSKTLVSTVAMGNSLRIFLQLRPTLNAVAIVL